MILLTVPTILRTGSSRFAVDLPLNFTDSWVRVTVVMSDLDMQNPLNIFFLRLFHTNGANERQLGGQIKWQGNPLIELDRPDISFPVLHKRGDWNLKGETVSFELDLRAPMTIGAVVEGVTFSSAINVRKI